ncbi:MAG: hypothetical protein M3464_05460 [Chloroflexota bacterium]|nr:hypothetical protein [Chloroflexota bacterium]
MSDYYRVGRQPIGTDDIALFEFGGEIGDPIGAKLRVAGWTRVRIAVPTAILEDTQKAYPAFQVAVRRFASRYDFQGFRRGTVDIVWKPAFDGEAWQDEEPGEPVDRVV